MTVSDRLVDGTILRLRCEACGAVFPHFSFSGEEDSDTVGLYSATSCKADQVVLAEADPSEWNELAGGDATSIERQLAKQVGRSDLKVVRLLRTEHDTNVAAGLSFADFRKTYRPPVLVYSCACCANGESRALEELTVECFKQSGGGVMLTGRLVLAQEERPNHLTD